MRRFVERLATSRPVVVVLDDLQWAEPTLLDLVEHLADWITGVPVLLLVMARPELLDLRSGWSGGKANATTFRLEPLPPAETERLVDELLEGAALPEETRARLAAAADGNPLYVEQVVEVLLDDGVLRRGADGTLEVGDVGAITVPPTMQACSRLASTVSTTGAPDDRAGVGGRQGVPPDGGPGADARAGSRRGRDAVPIPRSQGAHPARSRPPADVDETYRFRHLLIRDAAYDGLPKGERAELHERFADWLEETGQGQLAELDEIAGYHLEQARAYRLALAPDDARTQELARTGRPPAGDRGNPRTRAQRRADGRAPARARRGAPRRRSGGPLRRPWRTSSPRPGA